MHELFRLYDTEFLAAAYETLLGRPLDAAGLRSYLTRLREGHDRESFVYALATSPEGVRFQSDLDGLPQFLNLQRRLQTSRLAIALRFVYRLRRQQLQANRLENMIGCLESRISRLEGAQQIPLKISSSYLTLPEQPHDVSRFIKSARAFEIFSKLNSNGRLEG